MNKNPQISTVVEYIKTKFGTEPEFLWPERYPDYAIFRHKDNKKWFVLVATIFGKNLGLEDDKKIDIINLKFDKDLTYDFAKTSDHIFPAYHMNKNNWITIILDGTLSDEFVFELIEKSFSLTNK